MVFKYSVDSIKGTIVKSYVAQIMGEDKKYVFKRRFLRRSIYRSSRASQTYEVELGGHGVFELSVKRLDKNTGKLLSYDRQWFVYYRRRYCYISREEVLLAKMNLDLQYKNTSSFAFAENMYKAEIPVSNSVVN